MYSRWIPRLVLAAGVVLIGVAVHEWQYASDHPDAYGPAKVIAYAALAATALAGAIWLLAVQVAHMESKLVDGAPTESRSDPPSERVPKDTPTVVVLPRLGAGMEAGTVTKWLKAEGDPIEKGDPLYELDTDKVTQEVEADASGFLVKILVPEGNEVAVGYPIAVIDEGPEATT
jgi:biotin carboxyl carrier protein